MYVSIAVAIRYALIASHLVTVIAGPAEQVARDRLGLALPAAGIYAPTSTRPGGPLLL